MMKYEAGILLNLPSPNFDAEDIPILVCICGQKTIYIHQYRMWLRLNKPVLLAPYKWKIYLSCQFGSQKYCEIIHYSCDLDATDIIHNNK